MFTERGSRLPRKWSNEVLRLIGVHCRGDVVNISGWEDGDKEGGVYRDYFPNCDSYTISNYGGVRGTRSEGQTTDMHLDLARPIDRELESTYDVVFNHTTLEHVFEVNIAFQNLCRMSRDLVIVVVPFAQVFHPTKDFGDYWRFTPQSIRKMFEHNNYNLVHESANPHQDAGIYILSVGTCQPQRWNAVLPASQTFDKLGGWIGHNVFSGIFKKVKTKLWRTEQL